MPTGDTIHWTDANPRRFSIADRESVTLLTTGLPHHILNLLQSLLSTVGLNVEVMEEPDNQSLQFGREFGNRGQCNPTYFTVGNLIKYLVHLRDEQGMSYEDIVTNYAFVTAGGCGPCRMGMYATEYRKALRDSGFPDFRVLLFTRSGDVEDILMEGLGLNFLTLIKFFVLVEVGDILNTINLRYRPYEKIPGQADELIYKARLQVQDAIIAKKGFSRALYQARKTIKSIELDRGMKKPMIHIMGEFWAKTTDGEGNYNLFRFLEKEGAVVSNETLTDWLLHQVWRAKWLSKRKDKGVNRVKNQLILATVMIFIRSSFKILCFILGENFKLSNHAKLAKLAEPYFDIHVDGGEDHMEVAHHIDLAKKGEVEMIISVKPFTCLSSSGVSDGVQVKVCEDFPSLEFLAVETNGDSATNFYSRVHMGLQKVLARY